MISEQAAGSKEHREKKKNNVETGQGGGRWEKGGGRREKGEGRREKGEGRRGAGRGYLANCWRWGLSH